MKQMLGQYRVNRDFCLQSLRKMKGVTVPKPEGAFYLFPKIEGLTDSFQFCKDLLLETKVGLAPASHSVPCEGSVASATPPTNPSSPCDGALGSLPQRP